MSRMTLQEGLSGVRAWLQEKTAGGPYGCLILRSGDVAAAWYGAGFHEGSLFEIGSIRKSFNSALVGQALERGEITLDLRAGETWPEIAEISGRSADRNLTLHQLMSGIQAAECANPGIPGPPYGYNWFTNTKRALWPSAPEDSYGHPGFGTFKPTEAPSRAYLWVCRRLAASLHSSLTPGPVLPVTSLTFRTRSHPNGSAGSRRFFSDPAPNAV